MCNAGAGCCQAGLKGARGSLLGPLAKVEVGAEKLLHRLPGLPDGA